MADNFKLEDVIEGLLFAATGALETAGIVKSDDYDAARAYIKSNFGIDVKKIENDIEDGKRIKDTDVSRIAEAIQKMRQDPKIQPHLDESIDESNQIYKGSVVKEMRRIARGASAKKSTASAAELSDDEVQELRDRFIKTLSKMGYKKTSSAIDRFLKDKATKKTLRGTIIKEEGAKKGSLYEVAVHDLVMQFIAGEARKTIASRRTVTKREDKETYDRETEDIKKIQSELGRLGFPTTKEKSGGRVTASAKTIRDISLKDPETASFLMGLLFYDDKGNPRKNIGRFTGDWEAIVKAIHDTPPGTPLERLQSAIQNGTVDRGILRVLSRNLSGATDNIVVKPGKNGELFDLSALLETYGKSSSLFERLFAVMTGIKVHEIRKISKETQDDLKAKDDAKAARIQRRALADVEKKNRAAQIAEREEKVSLEIAIARTIVKNYKIKTSLEDRLRDREKDLDNIIAKLRETDTVSGTSNTVRGAEREKLVEKAKQIVKEINQITGVFTRLGLIDGLTKKQKGQIREAGLRTGVTKAVSERLEKKISLATNRDTGSTEMSTKLVSQIEKRAQEILEKSQIKDGPLATLMAILEAPGSIYTVEQKDFYDIIRLSQVTGEALRNAEREIKKELGKTKGLSKNARRRLHDAIRGALNEKGVHGKAINSAHDTFIRIVNRFIAHSQKVYANADPKTRGELIRPFAESIFQFQEIEKFIIAKHLGTSPSLMRSSTYETYSLLYRLSANVMDAETGKTGKKAIGSALKAMNLKGRITGIPEKPGDPNYFEFLYALQILSGEINLSAGLSGRADFLRTVAGAANLAEQEEEIKKITLAAATAAEDIRKKNVEEKTAEKIEHEKNALETIKKILAGDKAAFSDPKEMLKLVGYISGARGGKLTATNFLESLLKKISDTYKLGATSDQISKLATLFKVGPEGAISGPSGNALLKAGVDIANLADSMRKALDPKGTTEGGIGKALADAVTKSFLEGGDLFKKTATKGLQKDLTKAAEETAVKLEQASERRAKREARAAAGPRTRTTRAKLGELQRVEDSEGNVSYVDERGLGLGFKDRGFRHQGIPPAGEDALKKYMLKQGLIANPEDLKMSKGKRGTKPLIDLSATKFVSETAKEIAGIVQDVRAKAMKIDPKTGGKLAAAAAGSLTDLVRGKGFEKNATGGRARDAFNAAVDSAMQDPTVVRRFTKGGVKQEQTAPEFFKELQDKAAAKGKPLTQRAARAKFLKAFKGDAATAVASRLGIDVTAGGDAGKAIVGKLTQQQQDAADAKQQARDAEKQAEDAAKAVKRARKEVGFRQKALADTMAIGGELEKGQAGPVLSAKTRALIAARRVQAMPLHERSAAYAKLGLAGAPAVATGGAPGGQVFTGQGMQFVQGATIAIPQVDIGPLKELASQMADVGKSLALIPKATIPKNMSASLKEIAALMQVLATVKSPPKGTNVAGFKKLIQDLSSLASSMQGKKVNTTNVGNIIAAIKSVNKILDALSAIGTKMPAKTLLQNMQEFRKSLAFIPRMFSSLGNMDFAAISNIGATIASTKFPSQQRLAGIVEALLMVKQILETAGSMKGGRMPTVTGGVVGGGGVLGRIRGRVYARQEALASRMQGPGFGRYGRNDRFGARSIDAVRSMPLRQRLDYYDQIRAQASGGGGQRPPRERPVRSGGGGNRFSGGGRQTAPAGQFGVPRQIGGPMGPQISTGGVQQFSNDAMGILGNLAQQIRFGFTQEITREIAQSFGRILAHLKDGIIKFNSTLETATVAFQTLFENEQKAQGMEVNFKKAKEEAEGLVAQIKQFANVTPFRFPQLAESARRMRAFGFETREILPNMQAIGDAVAALGGEDDKIFRITYALGQMRQAGRVYQNDMMQLANAGIAGYDILSKALLKDFVKLGNISISHNGKVIDRSTIQTEEGYNDLTAAINAATEKSTRSQVKIVKSSSSQISQIFDRVSKDPIEAIRDLTQSGQIAGGAASSAIIEGLGDEYGGGMRKLAKTFEGAFSTLADVTQAFVADITKPVFESIRDEMIELGRFLQTMFVANIVKNVAKGFSKIVGPVQEVIGSMYKAISSIITGIIQLFAQFTGAFSLMEKVSVKFVDGMKQITYTFDKTKGAGQEFITRIGGGLKIVADLLQFPLAKGLAAAALGFKILSAAWNMNPLLLTLTAVTVGLTYLRDFLSSGGAGSVFADQLSGAAASLSALARNFKQQIMPIFERVMVGIGGDFVVGLVVAIQLMIPLLKQFLVLLNSILELMNALPFVPEVMGLLLGFKLLSKMVSPLMKIVTGVPATVDARGNPVAATKGLLGTLESAVRTITAKILPHTTLVQRAPTSVMQRGIPRVPVGTLGKPGAQTGFGAIPGNLQKILVPAANKKMLSSQMLKQLLSSGQITEEAYQAGMAARRAAMEAAARTGTGPGGISGLRELARTRGGTSAALKALGGGFADPTLPTTVRINSLVEAIRGMFRAFRNLNIVISSINRIKLAGNVIGNFTKSLALAAKSLPKAALSGINRLLKSFVLASALKFNSSVFGLVPKVFVPFMDAVKATGVRGTGGDIVNSVRRAAAAGVSRAGRLSLAGAQVPFSMPQTGVTGGSLGYLVRAIRGLRPNRLPFEAPGGAASSIAQRIRPQVLGGSPSMYGVSIFKVIQERIKYLTGKVADTAGLYAARITTAFEKSFMAFHRMMIRLAGAPARIFTMQNFDKIITRYAEAMVKGFTPKTAPIAGFLAGGTKKTPTELFSGLKDAIARRVIPNTLVGAPKPTFTDKIFSAADKLAKVSERFAETMVRGFAPKTVPIERFLAGGTPRVPRELFAGFKDAIARIVIPDKFTQPISIFQRAVTFFKGAISNFGSFVKAMGASVSGAGGNILSKFGATIIGGGGAALAAIRASKGMALASSSIKAVGSGIMGAVNKIGKFNLILTALLAGNTIRERIGAEGEKNTGAIVGQELTGAAGALVGGRVIGGMITSRIGTAIGGLAGPVGMIIGTVVGQMIGSVLGSLVFPGQEVTPAEQEKTAKEAAVAEYMADQVMSAQEFTQLLTDFDFTPVELVDLSINYAGSIDAVFQKIQDGVSTVMPSLQDSLSNMLAGLGSSVNEEIKGTTFMKFATTALEKVRAAIQKYYENLGNTPQQALALAQAEISSTIAGFGQVKTLDEANSVLQQLANSWQVNIAGIKGFNLFIGNTNNNLEKLQSNLEKIRSEFQKLAARLQSRINAVFEQQMAKALEKAKDAFLATQIVMVDGMETNILALREEIEATEKRNKLLAIEKKLREAARSVEMAKLAQYDASMDPLEAAARMREAQEAQTEAVREAALERKKIALEEAMASDPVVAGLEAVDERFEAARMKFQEGMEDILDQVEQGKITGTQAAAKIKELYTTTLGEVGVLDANLDVDAHNFGDAFLGTWDSILKKFQAIVTKLKKAIAAVNNYDPNAGDNSGGDGTQTTPTPNDSSNYGGRGFDNWREFGVKYEPAAIKAAVDARIRAMMDTLIYAASSEGAMKAYPKGRADRNAYQGAAARALTQFTSTSGIMYKASAAAAASKPEAASNIIDAARNKLGTYFQYVDELQNVVKLKNPIAGMASGGEIMGVGGMFQVGESGRETLQVVPGGVARIFPRRIRPINQVGMAGGGGGGINASVIINNPTVRSDQDIRKLADAVGKAQSSLLRSAGIGRI